MNKTRTKIAAALQPAVAPNTSGGPNRASISSAANSRNRWRAIVPGNAMPNVGLTEKDERDVAAYLHTLR